ASQVPAELERVKDAMAAGSTELVQIRDETKATRGAEIGSIFDFHLLLLKDKTINKEIAREITTNRASAEYAVSVVMRRYAQQFLNMPDRYFSERVKDVHDIERRLLRHLVGQKREDLTHLTS